MVEYITDTKTVATSVELIEIKWERVAISALIGLLVGALGYGATKKGWVGALSGVAGAGLAYFLVPLPETV